MSNLEKLLEGAEVEWKPLGVVCKVLRGKRLTKRDLVQDGIYPIFHGGLEPIGYYSENNRRANSTMVINVGASAGTVGFCKHDFWSSDGCFCFSHNDIINQRYLFYALQSIENTIKSNVRKAGIPTLDNKYIERILIPIPCSENKKKSLEIQRNIVDILDKFTTLEAELEAELEARKLQYEYYRDKLFSFSNTKATL
jgi:type I restriction enzyme, S subunit